MIIRFFVLAVVIGFLGPAQAQVLERAILNVPASACTPDADTIRFNRHVTTNSSVQHAPGNVDKITLICPITSMPSTDFNGISNWVVLLTYLDSNGANAMAQVR